MERQINSLAWRSDHTFVVNVHLALRGVFARIPQSSSVNGSMCHPVVSVQDFWSCVDTVESSGNTCAGQSFIWNIYHKHFPIVVQDCEATSTWLNHWVVVSSALLIFHQSHTYCFFAAPCEQLTGSGSGVHECFL